LRKDAVILIGEYIILHFMRLPREAPFAVADGPNGRENLVEGEAGPAGQHPKVIVFKKFRLD
jgi:hypothetical protein